MQRAKRSVHAQKRHKTGRGLVNSLINSLPVELHLPGYQYCGPGTKLQKRLKRGDNGVNPLDAACRVHDIAYSVNNNNLEARHKADYELEQKAWNRVKSKDANFGEKAAAWLVTNIMKVKRRFGMGCKSTLSKRKNKRSKRKKTERRKKSRKVAFGSAIRKHVRATIRAEGGNKLLGKDLKKATKFALIAARKSVKASGGRKKIRTPRIIPIPKVGGVLPLIPIFAGLSALGSLAGGAAGIVKAVNAVKSVRNNFASKGNINEVRLNSKGNGLYLKPYRTGLGLFLKSSKN
jgi:hypothetical protein